MRSPRLTVRDMLVFLVTGTHTQAFTHMKTLLQTDMHMEKTCTASTLTHAFTCALIARVSYFLPLRSLCLSPHTQYDSGRQNVFAPCSDLIWKPQTWDNVDPWWPSVWPKENDPLGSGCPAPNNCEAVRQWSLAYGAVEFSHTALIYWAMYLWLIRTLHAVSRQKTRQASAGWWSGMLLCDAGCPLQYISIQSGVLAKR